jgi:hypothetical protein
MNKQMIFFKQNLKLVWTMDTVLIQFNAKLRHIINYILVSLLTHLPLQAAENPINHSPHENMDAGYSVSQLNTYTARSAIGIPAKK